MKLPTLFGRSKKPQPKPHFDPVKSDAAFCAVGDVHGRIDLLERLVNALPEDVSVICVGDLVDRGDHSADVLRFVQERPNTTTLIGNHEAMMIDFLRDPEKNGRRWLRNGGLQTLASFGVSGVTETSGGERLARARDILFDAMGEPLVHWISTLDCIAWSGNVAVVHAGADPNIPMEEHSPDTFIWGHPEFRKKPRTDGFWVVHGHTIVEKPMMQAGRISIDTGAYATGRLTAAVFSHNGVEFVST